MLCKPPGGSSNLWDLVSVLNGQDDSLLPASYSKGVMHMKHLLKFKTVCMSDSLVKRDKYHVDVFPSVKVRKPTQSPSQQGFTLRFLIFQMRKLSTSCWLKHSGASEQQHQHAFLQTYLPPCVLLRRHKLTGKQNIVIFIWEIFSVQSSQQQHVATPQTSWEECCLEMFQKHLFGGITR